MNIRLRSERCTPVAYGVGAGHRMEGHQLAVRGEQVSYVLTCILHANVALQKLRRPISGRLRGSLSWNTLSIVPET